MSGWGGMSWGGGGWGGYGDNTLPEPANLNVGNVWDVHQKPTRPHVKADAPGVYRRRRRR